MNKQYAFFFIKKKKVKPLTSLNRGTIKKKKLINKIVLIAFFSHEHVI